jgi:Family of unknown function (DUF5670)
LAEAASRAVDGASSHRAFTATPASGFTSNKIRRLPAKELNMLWMLFVLLLVAWFLAMVSSFTMGGFIHVVLVLAVITLIIQLVTRRRSAS